MKTYFTKYLPVEGEILKGDTYKVTSEGAIAFGEIRVAPGDRGDTIGAQKLKLFLCSRDIQVGDNVYREPESWKVFDKQPTDTNHGLWGFMRNVKPDDFKVIGEVSPEAVWVKEGDEFDADQIEIQYSKKYQCLCRQNIASDWWTEPNNCKHETEDHYNRAYTCGRKVKEVFHIKIRCPTCKTFH